MSEMIIGIGHVARVGKDTAAEALQANHGFVRFGFADLVKELAFECDPLVTSATRTVNTGIGHGRMRWVVEGVGGWEAAKDMYPEVRIFLQKLGEGARNVFGENFWVDQLMARSAQTPRVVIPDVRYRNEAEAIRAMGGKLIRINRPGRVAAGHISETELVDFDWDEEFDNTRGIVDLQQSVTAWVGNVLATQKKVKS